MANNDDFGYFGKGAEGYAHYMQTFERTQSASSGGRFKPKDFGEPHESTENESTQQREAYIAYYNAMRARLKLIVYLSIIGLSFVIIIFDKVILPLFNH